MEYGNDLKPKLLPMKLYHGSPYDFNTVKPEMGGGVMGGGFYTTGDPNEAKQYGDKLYEFEYKGGKTFDPANFIASPELQSKMNQLNKDYFTKLLNDPFSDKKMVKKTIDNFLKNQFTKEGKPKSPVKFFSDILFLTGEKTIQAALQKLGLGNYDSARVSRDPDTTKWEEENIIGYKKPDFPFNHFVVFDPKTLKMVRKTKLEE